MLFANFMRFRVFLRSIPGSSGGNTASSWPVVGRNPWGRSRQMIAIGWHRAPGAVGGNPEIQVIVGCDPPAIHQLGIQPQCESDVQPGGHVEAQVILSLRVVLHGGTPSQEVIEPDVILVWALAIEVDD